MYKMVHMKRTGETVKVVELKRKRMKQKGTKLRQEKDYLKKVDVKKRMTIVAQTQDAGVEA